MSLVTYRRTSPAGAGAWLCGGAAAAALGFGALAFLVLLLWTVSPYTDSGLGGAVQLAGDLWLLAHGVGLVRAGAAGGGSAPLGLPPMLLTALPVWLLLRAGRAALEERRLVPADRPNARAADLVHSLTSSEAPGGDSGGDSGGVSKGVPRGVPGGIPDGIRPRPGAWRRRLRAVGWLTVGYLLVAAAIAVFASAGPLRAVPLSGLLRLPLFAGCLAAFGVFRAAHAGGGLPALREFRIFAALRAAAVGTAVLCAVGALLAVGSLVAHATAVQESFAQLSDVWSGRLAVLTLAAALLPNAAVWAAAYGLGPGFTLGTGSVVGPFAANSAGSLPLPFPLLAAVPGGTAGYGGELTLLCALLVPLAAGSAMAWSLARAGDPVPGEGFSTALTALLGALGCGVLTAVLAAFAGGPLGRGALAHIGPCWWQTGAAALAWTAALAVPGALVLRALRLRGLAAAEPAGPAGWYDAGVRQARLATLKRSSGGLMTEFSPAGRRSGW